MRPRSVNAADGVEIVGYQGAADEERFGAGGFLPALLLHLNGALMGLPVAGDPVQDLVWAFAAGAESVGAGHRLYSYPGMVV